MQFIELSYEKQLRARWWAAIERLAARYGVAELPSDLRIRHTAGSSFIGVSIQTAGPLLYFQLREWLNSGPCVRGGLGFSRFEGKFLAVTWRRQWVYVYPPNYPHLSR